ncbi:MAG TPA: thiamine pyrophosphate-dependent enzyme [Actinomycetales bacterium]|nr:thiamine pyrophosphate-dependent enzyme [Actinomycetales bacterium]
MRRIEALRVVAELCSDLPVVATCAATSRELAATGDRENYLYLLDSMGLTTSVGTGIALAVEGTAVSHAVVVDGDGSLLMNLGALATAGYLAPTSLLVVLLDNQVYASTGSIPTQAAQIDLGGVARACGLRVTAVDDEESLRRTLGEELQAPGPTLLHVRVDPGNEPDTALLLIDPVVHGARFGSWLQPRLG